MRLLDSDLWEEIFDSLRKNRTRTFLTAFGIGRTVLLTVDTTTHYSKLKEGQDRAEIRLATPYEYRKTGYPATRHPSRAG